MSTGLDVKNSGTGDGISGTSQDSAGVHGIHSGAKNGFGVLGNSQTNIGAVGVSGASAGVFGYSVGGFVGTVGLAGGGGSHGVAGAGDNGMAGWGANTGVYGEARAGQAAIAGVYGLAHGSTEGVIGQSDRGPGVRGDSDKGVGVIGSSTDGHGVDGFSQNDVGVAAFTSSNDPSMPALFAAGTTAAEFAGGVRVGGDLRLTGNLCVGGRNIDFGQDVGDVLVGNDLLVLGNKMAAVRHPDGSQRMLYCMESPESWFEDFGRARLVRGKAAVKLDRTFAAVVRGDYHVFLSPEGDCRGLCVSRRTRHGFEVREVQRGTSTVQFSYRIVARRRGVTAPRFKRLRPFKAAALLRLKRIKRPALTALPGPRTRPSFPQLPELPRNLVGAAPRARSRRTTASRRSARSR